MSVAAESLLDFCAGPFRELLHGLDAVLRHGARSLLLVGLGLLAGWWLYVPAHELLHAFGCWAAGGEVSRLEIDPIYGAAVLARVFPFVSPGGTYAGRLSGFDPHGNDWIYGLTDLTPFVLAIFPGFWWLRRAARSGGPIAFGMALPPAFAPLLSLSGDAYEMGSLLVVRLPWWAGQRVVIGDDLGAKVEEIARLGVPALQLGVAVGALFGLLWAFSWVALSRRLATGLGQKALVEARSIESASAGSS